MQRNWQSYELQKGGQKNETLSIATKFLEKISGGRVADLCKSILLSKKVACKEICNCKSHNKCNKIITNIQQNVIKSQSDGNWQDTKRFLSLISCELQFQDLLKLGFSITKEQFASARKHAIKNGPGSQIPKPMQPNKKRKISEAMKNQISDFLVQDNISVQSSKRTVSINRQFVPVREIQTTFTNAYEKFQQDILDPLDKSISKSTFMKNRPKFIRKPIRKTGKFQNLINCNFKFTNLILKLLIIQLDMCHICEVERNINTKINNYTKEIDFYIDIQYKQNLIEKVNKLKENLEVIRKHKDHKDQRKSDFEKQVSQLINFYYCYEKTII